MGGHWEVVLTKLVIKGWIVASLSTSWLACDPSSAHAACFLLPCDVPLEDCTSKNMIISAEPLGSPVLDVNLQNHEFRNKAPSFISSLQEQNKAKS